jgi:hypothetical protein
MAGELVSCKDSDANSPATVGLLAIGFNPNSNCVLRETWLVWDSWKTERSTCCLGWVDTV